jgi:hypothetical protein
MAEILKFEKRSKALGEKLPAPLRELLDAVVIPALIDKYKEHVSEMKTQKELASTNFCVADSAATASREVP